MRIGASVVNNLQPIEHDIAMVFQNYALHPKMIVASDWGFAPWMARVPNVESSVHRCRAADILSLRPDLDRYPHPFSGRQRQRAARGRANMRNPKVFLFDVPLSNLHAKQQMRTRIRMLHLRLKTTTISVNTTGARP